MSEQSSHTATKLSGDFDPEQKRYLEGFMSGLQIGRAARGAPASAAAPSSSALLPGAAEPTGPDAAHLRAQDRFLQDGKKLSDPEKFKRELHPFDAYQKLKEQAVNNEAPKAADNFRWRFYGLFYCAPNQTAYMCRLRIPNGILKHWQLAGVGDLADRYAGGYAHVTTRANLQMREVEPKNAVALLEAIQDLGLCSRGSGADNIRNVTGTPTAGIDPQELIDTRPYARKWHFHILNDRSLYGLPRKFNVGFDGRGIIPVLEETSDIGFAAVAVRDGFGVAQGVWFRLMIGGITGHRDFAHATGILVRPDDSTKVADAIVRGFIDHGDRSDSNQARLKYVIDRMGLEQVLALTEEKLGRKLDRVPNEALLPRPACDRQAHIGVHPQKQADRHWIGVVLPVGKMTSDQRRALAALAGELGDGDIRLTVWQNLLISGVASENVQPAQEKIAALGLSTSTNSIRAGLVACTGNVGCKFAASDTKRHAEDIARWCESRVTLDGPVNIHLTGCHNSCAQHYIGDIGLLACKVATSEEGDTVEGYHVHVGGGFGANAALAREIFADVKAHDVPALVERMLKTYMARRSSPDESFQAFTLRHEVDALRQLFAEGGAQ